MDRIGPIEALETEAVARAGCSDFGDPKVREGLKRLVASLDEEADLSPVGVLILRQRLMSLLVNRLRVEDEHRRHPEISEQQIEGPIFIIGLPRTGTTALSQLVACDPQIRSLRLWESQDPVPPPVKGLNEADPRVASTQAGLDLLYQTFPKMRSLYFQTATGATECQDLLGMSFRTLHFDGMASVPSYTSWALHCDMEPAYRFHRRVLQLLQWRCPPRLWHLKTPVHVFALDALDEVYPESRFLWTHRDPAEVLGSVCSLVAYTRSWVSDRADDRLGPSQVALWCEGLRRAMEFRERVGESRFADVYFGPLNADPVATVAAAYRRLGLRLSGEAASAMAAWAAENPRGGRGSHEYRLEDVGLEEEGIRQSFRAYIERFDVVGG